MRASQPVPSSCAVVCTVRAGEGLVLFWGFRRTWSDLILSTGLFPLWASAYPFVKGITALRSPQALRLSHSHILFGLHGCYFGISF